jgi:proton-dependent oligopeptide transporter, POT family
VTAAALPVPADDRRFFGHPRGLALLFVAEMWERFSYYGMRALLVLYLINGLGWSDARAYELYGTYTGLVWLTPMIGGWIADRWLGTHKALLIGGAIIAAGHFTLALPGLTAFYSGLGLVVLGTGLFKPNASTMVGQLYAAGDGRRDTGYTIFYMGINTGATIAPLVCSWLGETIGWHWGFAAAGVGMVLGLVSYAVAKRSYLGTIGDVPAAGGTTNGVGTESGIRGWHALLGGGVGLALAYASGGLNPVALLTGTVIGAAMAAALLSSHGDERRRVIALCLVVFFVIFFWMAFEQAGSSMNVFADRHTQRAVGSFTIPAGWFQSVQPFTLVLFAPAVAAAWTWLARRGSEPSTPMKMSWGLGAVGLSFVVMAVAGRAADAGLQVSPWWLVSAYCLQSLGELAVSPVGLSYVSKVAPARLASLAFGLFFLSNAAASKAAGMLAAQTERIGSLSTFFLVLVATSLGAAVVLVLLVPMLRRLTASVKA